MLRPIKSILRRIPAVQSVLAERDALKAELRHINPGHFYSPIPEMSHVRDQQSRIFDRTFRELPGIDLNVNEQLSLLTELAAFYAELPYHTHSLPHVRYHFDNGYYTYSDAIFLYSMIRRIRPKRIIEIGSGWSSFVMLDTNERFFNEQIHLTFIEPYPERLRFGMRNRDFALSTVIEKPLQSVDSSVFSELGPGDILFIDSSHVGKIDSDVNRIIFEILPRLAQGVFVHIHDVSYPFEYPLQWLENGWYWNEAYLMRAFLQHNSAFKIRIWNHFLGLFAADRLTELMPLCLKNIGASLWLERVG